MKNIYYTGHSPSGAALTSLILTIFHLNGRFISAGDQLVKKIGLTGARWQVIGAIVLADTPQPVANLARNMGLSRQAVQRLVNELVKEDFVRFIPNPHHQRAKLVILSDKGQKIYDATIKLQIPWVNQLAKDLDSEKLIKITADLQKIIQSFGQAPENN